MNIKNKAKKNTKSQTSQARELNAQEIKAVSGGYTDLKHIVSNYDSIAGKTGEIIVDR